MKFQREEFSDALVNEMMPLFTAHYKETASNVYGPMSIDVGIYKILNDSGALRIFTVRDMDMVSGANILRGYQVFLLGTHPHSKDSYEATQDILYLALNERRGMMGYKFLKWCTEELTKDSVRVIHQRISARHDFGHLLERMGFRLEDLIYSKEVA